MLFFCPANVNAFVAVVPDAIAVAKAVFAVAVVVDKFPFVIISLACNAVISTLKPISFCCILTNSS